MSEVLGDEPGWEFDDSDDYPKVRNRDEYKVSFEGRYVGLVAIVEKHSGHSVSVQAWADAVGGPDEHAILRAWALEFLSAPPRSMGRSR